MIHRSVVRPDRVSGTGRVFGVGQDTLCGLAAGMVPLKLPDRAVAAAGGRVYAVAGGAWALMKSVSHASCQGQDWGR